MSNSSKGGSNGRGSRQWTPYAESSVRESRLTAPKTHDRSAGLLVSLAVWDAIARAAADARLGTYERATLDAVLHETARYGRIWQTVPRSHTVLSDWCGIPRGNVGTALNALRDKGFIHYRPGSPHSSPEGHRQTRSLIRLRVPDGWHLQAGLQGNDNVELCNVDADDGPESQDVGGPESQDVGGPESQDVGGPDSQDVGGPDSQDVGGPDYGTPYGEGESGESLHEEVAVEETFHEEPTTLYAERKSAAGQSYEEELEAWRLRADLYAERESAASQSYEDKLEAWRLRADEEVLSDPVVKALSGPGPDWREVVGVPELLEEVTAVVPRSSPLAATFTMERRQELLDGYRTGMEEYDDEFSMAEMAWLIGHWLGYKLGKNADYSQEHLHRAVRQLPALSTSVGSPFEFVRSGYAAGAVSRHAKERPKPAKPWPELVLPAS